MRSLITGIAGQDGSWLAEHLLARGDEVHGVVRAADRRDNIAACAARLTLHETPLSDAAAVADLLAAVAPDRCFHLAAQSSAHRVDVAATIASNSTTTVHLLEAIASRSPKTRFFFAGSAEQLSGNGHSPQRESDPELPRTAYGVSKTMAAAAVRYYRRERGVFAVVGVLYNHESIRRDPSFLSRKMARAAARVAAGLDDHVDVGDLGAVRDWGYAPEYVDAFARMLEADSPNDLVIATGVGRTVKDLADVAFAAVGLDAAAHLRVSPELVRPREPYPLVGDPSLAARLIGWTARKPFDEMMREMVAHEQRALRGLTPS